MKNGGDKMFSNIYLINNKVNNKKYVGQSVDVKKRWYTHKNNAKHESDIYLYNAMKKYGIENFEIKVIEKNIPLEKINEREEFWIKELNTLRPNGYNLTLGGEGTKGYVMSVKTKNKISEIAKNRYNSLSDEEKQEMVDRLPDDGYDLDKMNQGVRRWFATAPREVIAEKYKRVVETKKKKGYDFYNFSFGKMNENEKKTMYEKISKNNPRSQAIIMFDINDNYVSEFHSIGEASRYLNKEYNITLNSKNLIRKVLDTDKLAYNYKWKRK